MFRDPGEKLKTAAYALFVVCSIACIITGVLYIRQGFNAMVIKGILVICLGLIVSYVVNLVIYAFGNMIVESGQSEYEEKNVRVKSGKDRSRRSRYDEDEDYDEDDRYSRRSRWDD